MSFKILLVKDNVAVCQFEIPIVFSNMTSFNFNECVGKSTDELVSKMSINLESLKCRGYRAVNLNETQG